MPKSTRGSERAPLPSHGYPRAAICRKGQARPPTATPHAEEARAALNGHPAWPHAERATGPPHTPKGPRSPSLGCPRAAACPRRVSRLPTTDTRERPHAERATCGPERARPRHPQPDQPCTHPVCSNTHATPPSSAAAAHGRSSRPRTHGHRAHGHKAHGHKAHGHCSHGLSAAASKNTSCNSWARLFPL